MIVVKRCLGLLLAVVCTAGSVSASLVIDPFSTALPVLVGTNSPTVPTQNVGNADRFLTRSNGGVTTAGNTTVDFAAGTRTVSLFYDLRSPVDLNSVNQNALTFNYSAINGIGVGSYSVAFSVLNAFSPGAAVLSQSVVNGLALSTAGTTVFASSGSFSNVAALSNAQYLQVSITRDNNASSGSLSFTSDLLAAGTPEPASWALAALTGLGAVVAVRRRRMSRSAEVVC